MLTTGLVLTTFLALSTSAAPLNTTTTSILESRAPPVDPFAIHVWNNCHFTKEVALYQVTPKFKMLRKSLPANIPSKGSHIFHADFNAQGMRLSGHAEWPLGDQWNAQALFEFQRSADYASQKGTAYDLSVMPGSDKDIGIGVYPIPNGKGSGSCESKTCFPWYCPAGQGWTDPNQAGAGSPADTVCYKGKTDFKVVFCP